MEKELKKLLKDNFVDSGRTKAIRLALTKAYSENDRERVAKAAQEAQGYVDEGGDFDDWQFDDSIEDYIGDNAEMLTEKYLVRLLHDRHLDDDVDKDYINTGWHIDFSANYKKYNSFRKDYPDAVLLFNDDGEAYCAYEEDAEKMASACDCPLLNWNGVKVSGFPYHALNLMLPKLIRAGHRVAVCDELQAPKRKIQKRITETVKRKEPIQLSLF